jgi:hypothetical protein
MAWLRDLVPQMRGALQVGLPLLWGALCAAATHQGALTGRWRWIAVVLTFPLLWIRGASIPSAGAWIGPLSCWTVALLSVGSRHRSLRAALLFATGASTSALQLWQLTR